MKQESFPSAIIFFTGRCVEISDDLVALVNPRSLERNKTT